MTNPEQGGELARAIKMVRSFRDFAVRAESPVLLGAWELELILAALERQAELVAALREYIEWADQLHPDKPFTIEQLLVAIGFAEEFETLLARSAEEVGERG